MSSPRVDLKPLFAVVTLAIGVGFVAVIQMVTSLFAAPAAAPAPLDIIISRPYDLRETTQPAKLELSCYDPQILPVWTNLKNDKEFKVRMEGSSGLYDCAGLLEVKHIDLNNDARTEVLARGKGTALCRNNGSGCGLWVFSNKDDRYRVLLSNSDTGDTARVDDLVRKSRTRGYADLLLKDFGEYSDPIYVTFIYNGRDYVESNCVYEVPKQERGVGAYEIVQCDEYERNADD